MPAMRRGNNTDSGYPRDRRVGNRKPQNAALRHLSGLTPSKKHRASSPRVRSGHEAYCLRDSVGSNSKTVKIMKTEFSAVISPLNLSELLDNSTFNVLYLRANCLRAFQRVELLDHCSWCAFRGFIVTAI